MTPFSHGFFKLKTGKRVKVWHLSPVPYSLQSAYNSRLDECAYLGGEEHRISPASAGEDRTHGLMREGWRRILWVGSVLISWGNTSHRLNHSADRFASQLNFEFLLAV